MEDIAQTKGYRNGGKVFKESYSSDRMAAIKKSIQKLQEYGKNQKYSISVDNIVVVPTTSEIEDFDAYVEFLNLDTRVVEVRMYFGASPNSNRHIFYLKDESLGGLMGQGNLSGMDVDNRIQEALDKQRLETEVLLLRKKLKSRKRQIEELEELLSKEPETKVDMNTIMDKGVQLFGMFQQGQGSAALPMQGAPQETVEVQLERTPAQQAFDLLKSKYPDHKILDAINTWSELMARPELQEQIIEFLNTKRQQS